MTGNRAIRAIRGTGTFVDPTLPVIAPSSRIASHCPLLPALPGIPIVMGLQDRNPPGQVPGDRGKQERPRDSLPQQGCGGFLE